MHELTIYCIVIPSFIVARSKIVFIVLSSDLYSCEANWEH